MNHSRKIIGMMLAGIFSWSAHPAAPATDDQQVGYALGYLTGQGNSEHIPDLNVPMFEQGFQDAYSKQAPAMNEDQMKDTLEKFRSRMMMQLAEKKNREAAANKAAGDRFLLDNAKKPGVKHLADGLEYKVIKQGIGAHPKPTDTVKVQYEGKLLDGHIFDSSYQRNEPASFELGQVISGWTEGLQLMTPGSIYEFYIPPAMAYGENGAGPIPPNATLIFKVELLSIGKEAATSKTK